MSRNIGKTNVKAMTWSEIDLKALGHNIRRLRRITAPSAAMMAVVKADGYGHGGVEVAKTAVEQGATYLAVARLSEAVAIRRSGIAVPILLFGHTYIEYIDLMIRHNIRPTVNTLASARALSEAACRCGKYITIHVKIDTGMGRLGVVCDDLILSGCSKSSQKKAMEEVLQIASLPKIRVEGVYTHFANADHADKNHAERQFSLFMEILDNLKKNSFEPELRHTANSAALITMPETHLDLVRPGISLYGLAPSAETDISRLELKPVMTIKSTVIQVKEVGKGFSVSYGSTYRTKGKTKLATVAIGYGDSYSRLLSAGGFMLVKGQRAPIVGRVCMDLTVLDVGRIPDVKPEDEVVVLGRQGDEEITANDLADLIHTISYEIVSRVTFRVPRIFTR